MPTLFLNRNSATVWQLPKDCWDYIELLVPLQSLYSILGGGGRFLLLVILKPKCGYHKTNALGYLYIITLFIVLGKVSNYISGNFWT